MIRQSAPLGFSAYRGTLGKMAVTPYFEIGSSLRRIPESVSYSQDLGLPRNGRITVFMP